MKKDIKNAANHVFEDYSNCDAYFCNPEEYKNETNLVAQFQNCGLWTDIQHYAMNLASNAESLILNVTNNTVEQVNNVIAKFIGGKRVNYTARGSYQARCFGAVTSWNSDKAIHSRLSEKIQGCGPGIDTTNFINRTIRSREILEASRKRNVSCDKYTPSKKSKVTGPDESYGRLELEPDMPTEIFEEKKQKFLTDLNLP